MLSLPNNPEYLIRFDDICPTMRWSIWDGIEQVLIANDIRPILAVVPDNQDPQLRQEPAEPRFWDRVREWQARGWTIGLHGYQHTYVTKERGLIGSNRYSEFAGLPYPEQHRKLAAGMAILEREGVHPDLWVAPAHTFDAQTLEALRSFGIKTVSDGFGFVPQRDADGTFWIPQQLGRFHHMPFGFWTVCIHIDDPVHADVPAFAEAIKAFRRFLTDVPSVESRYGDKASHRINQAWSKALCWSKRMRYSGIGS